ncbi:MAG: hypothetical protein KDE03_05200 [Rhodobacteraceae bacterium]|nr:hypothetical protein [Paracoccaceae bacterium]
MKSVASSLQDYLNSGYVAPSFLRIAVPSWRVVGIHPESAATPEPRRTLSREEVQTLFQGELKPKPRRKSALTEREEQEKRLAGRIRRALYPRDRMEFSH